jgi:hypothetical protein
MSLTPKKLGRGAAGRAAAEQLIKDTLRVIDSSLAESPRRWGDNELVFELPSTIAIDGLERADAQLVVYAGVIASLRDRGFAVSMSLGSEHTFITIRWSITYSSAELAEMRRVIVEACAPPAPTTGPASAAPAPGTALPGTALPGTALPGAAPAAGHPDAGRDGRAGRSGARPRGDRAK